jgi:hypothetical protein
MHEKIEDEAIAFEEFIQAHHPMVALTRYKSPDDSEWMYGDPAQALFDGWMMRVKAAEQQVIGNEVCGRSPMWDWFGLSYSSYLVVPRVLLCGMPTEWQRQFAALLDRSDEIYDCSQINDTYTVLLRGERNQFVKDPYRNYRHFPSNALPYREKADKQ